MHQVDVGERTDLDWLEYCTDKMGTVIETELHLKGTVYKPVLIDESYFRNGRKYEGSNLLSGGLIKMIRQQVNTLESDGEDAVSEEGLR